MNKVSVIPILVGSTGVLCQAPFCYTCLDIVKNKAKNYGQCNIKVRSRSIVPPNDKKGDIARIAELNVVTPNQRHNGKEFAYHEKVTGSLKCDVYFADPYCSWQRGLNENTNGLLRQYWPKSTDFKKVSISEVNDVIVKLNERPRKKLNYKTPAKLMAEHMAAMAA